MDLVDTPVCEFFSRDRIDQYCESAKAAGRIYALFNGNKRFYPKSAQEYWRGRGVVTVGDFVKKIVQTDRIFFIPKIGDLSAIGIITILVRSGIPVDNTK